MQHGPAKGYEKDITDVGVDNNDTVQAEPSGDVEELFEIVKVPENFCEGIVYEGKEESSKSA
jgi:hypothetical protein